VAISRGFVQDLLKPIRLFLSASTENLHDASAPSKAPNGGGIVPLVIVRFGIRIRIGALDDSVTAIYLIILCDMISLAAFSLVKRTVVFTIRVLAKHFCEAHTFLFLICKTVFMRIHDSASSPSKSNFPMHDSHFSDAFRVVNILTPTFTLGNPSMWNRSRTAFTDMPGAYSSRKIAGVISCVILSILLDF